MRSLKVAATGMLAQQMNIDVISNNIANLSTTGFKRSRAEFQDLFYQNLERVGTTSSDQGTIVPAGVQLGLGVSAGSVARIPQQGTLQQTESKFDLAIVGRGYFQIERPNGIEAYSRAGSFQVNQDGVIVTPEGFPVVPGITIPQNAVDVSINEQGQVFVKLDNDPALQQVGQINLVNFINEAGLEAIGDNLFLESQASGPPVIGFAGDEGFGKLRQGFVESSNVNVINAITDLISAQRNFEYNSRVISASDQVMQTISQVS